MGETTVNISSVGGIASLSIFSVKKFGPLDRASL